MNYQVTMIVRRVVILVLFATLNTSKIGGTTCVESFKKVACLQETGYGHSLLNLRDEITWHDFKGYLNRLTCECYELARKNNTYKYFALRFYGICIGLPGISGIPNANGTKCINEGYKTCNISDSQYCVGINHGDLTFQIGVDGAYGQWSAFSTCSVTCGTGFEQRTRECNNPRPEANGKNCDLLGHSVETKSCILPECPTNDWGAWTPCTQTCDGGLQMRTRLCSNERGYCEEKKGCVNNLCKGPAGAAKAQSLVETFLREFHSSEFPEKKPTGKFYKAIFDVQKAVADAFLADDPSLKSLAPEERLKELESVLKLATEGGSIDFARSTLGKSLFAFIETKIKEGIAIDEINKQAGTYLKQVKTDIGQNKFDQIIPSTGGASLIFVIDTTGSMRHEIIASKAIARSVINDKWDFPVDYILSPFNDPKVGPVTYRSDLEKTIFLQDLNKLPATGGLDCPEPTFKGMLNALNYGPKYGSPMFVFTDATSKDDTLENMESLKQKANSLSCKIFFFTNTEGCKSGNKRGIESFKDIASFTAGQIFPLTSTQELLKYKNVVSESLKRDTTLATGGKLRGVTTNKAQTIYFNVENKMTHLLASISSSKINGVKGVKLISPSGEEIAVTHTLVMSKLFEILNPEVGTWSLYLPPDSGTFEYVIEAVANDAIDFTYKFIYVDDLKNPYSLLNPIEFQNNVMTVQLGGFHLVNMRTITLHLIDVGGNDIISNLIPQPLSEGTLQKQLTPPSKPFKLKITGKTIKGVSFQRVSRSISVPTNVFMRAIYAGKAFTVKTGMKQEIIKIQVIIFGKAEGTIHYFKCAATLGKATMAPNTALKKSGFIQALYDAPLSVARKGTLDTLTITTGESIIYTFSILII